MPQIITCSVILSAGIFLSLGSFDSVATAEADQESSPRRLAERSAATSVAGAGQGIASVKRGRSASGPSPRVSAHDSAPRRLIKRDAPPAKELASQDKNVSVLASEKPAAITGLRYRLLLEAAARALHSETPWSDLSTVALAFKRAGDKEAALYWFKRAARLAKDPDDQRAGSEAMREVTRSLILARYLDQAADLISQIPERKIRERSISDLVRAFAQNRKFSAARSLARTLSEANALGFAYRNIAEAEARYLSLDDALLTVRLISDRGIRDDALSRLASIRASAGDPDGAMSLVNKINDSRLRDLALVRLAKLESRGGRLSIESLSALIKDPFFRDQALREMVASEVERRHLDEATRAAHRIKNSTQRAKAYESLVMLQLRHRDYDGALARAQAINLYEFRNRALQAVAVAQVSANGVKSARNIANLIGDDELREITYRKIASRASVIGKSRLAVETIRYMGDPSERAMAFASVALTQANYGDDRAARRLARDADRELNEVLSEREFAKTVGVLAEVHAQTGDSNSAFQAAASIQNSGLRDLTYQKIALRFARSKEPDLATQSARLIERDLTRERALDSVADALAGGVSAADALDLVGDLETRSQQVRFLVAIAGRS